MRSILVREGDHVRRGQTLVELDPTASAADESQAIQSLSGLMLSVVEEDREEAGGGVSLYHFATDELAQTSLS